MAEIVLNLGSNIKPRMQHIRRAIGLLSRENEISAISCYYETEPILLQDDGGNFLNISLCLNTKNSLEKVFSECRLVENTIEKREKGNYLSRAIDIDLIYAGNLTADTEELKVPHRGITERSFFLYPLFDLKPSAIDPDTGKTYFTSNWQKASPPILRSFNYTLKQNPLRILIICSGNICRSPFAEAVLREMMRDSAIVKSAGILGIENEKASPYAFSEARKRGYDLSFHKSTALIKETVDWADLILVMDESHFKHIKKNYPAALYRTRFLAGWNDIISIQDPYGGDLETYRKAFDEIEKCLSKIKDRLVDLRNDLC